MILHKIANKCKSREFLAFLLVFGTGMASFGLGRMSTLDKADDVFPKIAEQNSAIATVLDKDRGEELAQPAPALSSSPLAEGGLVVASKNGTKYHFPWCAGAKAISEANKIWFKSEEEARLAGYTPASNCKGLK